MRNVLVVLFDGVQSLDVTGPVEVINGAETGCPGTYRIRTASLDGAPVRTTSGLTLVPDHSLADAPAPHTLLVPGGQGTRDNDARLVDWLRVHGPRAERLVSICTGAILLAEAGLLDGRRATTHWAYCDKLARDHPTIDVDPDPIFIRDGQVSTSAGVTSGIDLALALVEDDFGSELARSIARRMVVYYRRSGGQSQFSALLELDPQSDRIQTALSYARHNLRKTLSVEELAEVAHLSPRQFSRVFHIETGHSPAKAVENLRLEAAKTLIETSDHSIETIARETGFGDPERMRRAFVRKYALPPQAIKRAAQLADAELEAA